MSVSLDPGPWPLADGTDSAYYRYDLAEPLPGRFEVIKRRVGGKVRAALWAFTARDRDDAAREAGERLARHARASVDLFAEAYLKLLDHVDWGGGTAAALDAWVLVYQAGRNLSGGA